MNTWMKIKRRLEMDSHYIQTSNLGYQFTFFKSRFFFESAVGISYWPTRTGVQESFRATEKIGLITSFNPVFILDLSFRNSARTKNISGTQILVCNLG